MSRTSRSKGTSERSPNEGTSARTRPLSFEEIMLQRKKKLNPKDISADIRESCGNDGDEIVSDHSKTKRTERSPKNLKRTRDKSSKEGLKSNKEDNLKSRLGSKIVKGKSSNAERGRDREHMDEKNRHIRIRNDNRLGAPHEKVSDKKQQNETSVKDISKDRDWKSKKEEKRKSHDHNDGKSRSEIDRSSSKKHDSGKTRDLGYVETNDRRKVHSKPYSEELRSKRRRSRSQEYDRERDRRSISSSPKSHKRSHNEKDYAEPSLESFKEKSRHRYSDSDRNRSSGNGGYASGHYRKHESRLGGYSPRKRKTEAAVRTPSPTVRSPERKSTTWDQPPAGSSNPSIGSIVANLQPPSIKIREMPSSISVTTKPQFAPSLETVSTSKSASIDSVQLTQATRPLRRLYIENVPISASDKTVVDCLNDFLLLSGVNHIQGTKPCISCIINKEKCQALVEFITPEDATAALSFDGRFLSGSILKIRRPKDYIETAMSTSEKLVGEIKTAVPEKPVEEVKVISDVVKDSPRKIFIGGISRSLSSQMLMEIISAFGPLAAYRFEYNEELNGPCAYLEYVDSSITLKACAGLNGMKLGGHVLTVLQALPGAPEEEEGNSEVPPFYGIPLHAKPLLADATKVLQLKNVFDQDELLLLSMPELEETLGDIRLECARFGTVKSVNIVRQTCSSVTVTDAVKMDRNSGSASTESRMEIGSLKQNGDATNRSGVEELQDTGGAPEETRTNTEVLVEDPGRKEPADSFPSDENVVQEPRLPDGSSGDQQNDSVDVEEKITGSRNGIVPRKDQCAIHVADDLDHAGLGKAEVVKADGSMPLENSSVDVSLEKELEENRDGGNKYVDDIKVSSTVGAREAGRTEVDSLDHDLDAILPGSILVEFTRKEAACMAAHSLHGRLYGERVVTAGYAPYDLYLALFAR